MADDIEIEGFVVRLQPHGRPRVKGLIFSPGGRVAHKEIALGDSREACIADATAIILRLKSNS